MRNIFLGIGAAALMATSAYAEGWTLDGDASRLSVGSVKKHMAGEVHHFTGLSGTVTPEGTASIDIDLASLETYIDIRNERFAEHVFKLAPKANLATEIDMASLNDMAVGDIMAVELDGDLTILGNEVYVPVEATVVRISEDKVFVTSDMAYVTTEELGIDAGIDKLQEIAELSDITRAVPVTMHLVFTASGKGS